MTPDNPIYAAAVWIIPLIIAIVFHEVAHGLMARALGDPTAAQLNRLRSTRSAMSIRSAP